MMHLRNLGTAWLYYWLINSASARVVITPAAVHEDEHLQQQQQQQQQQLLQDNGNRGSLANSPKVIGLGPGPSSSLDRSRSSGSSFIESIPYFIRRTHDAGYYAHGYDNAIDRWGNQHFRFEERLSDGSVVGEYGYIDYRTSTIVTVTYTADKNGYRPIVRIRRL